MAIGETARLLSQLDLKDNFSGKIKGITNSLSGFESRFSRVGRGVGQVAGGIDRLATRAGIAAAGGLAAVVKTAADFELAFTGIEKTVDATEPQLAALEAQFRSMARTIPLSFEELAGIGAAGGALGIARKDLLDFTDVVARLSVSTNLSSDQAATALGQLGNVLHLRGQDFRDFADSLVALGNAGASTEDQIVEIAARFGAAGNSAGLTKEEILALSSAVASMGIQVEAGGSSLSRIFNSVATNIGTSSDKATAFAKTLGLSARQFKDAWQRDALGTFQEFLTELNKLDQFKQAAVLKDIGITNTRDIAAVRLMGQNVKFVADQLKISKNAQDALNVESNKFFATTSGQWKVLVNNVRDVGVTIGNEVLPVAKDLIAEFTTFLNKPETVSSLKDFGKDLATGIRGVVTELKGTDFSGLIGGMKLAASVAKGAFDAFRALPAPVQQLAIAALAANKLSGGAIGLITKGLLNIGGGLLPGKAGQAAGALLGRGSSPANPLFVTVVGPGGLAGGSGVAGGAAAGAKGFWAGVGKVLGLAFVATAGFEIGNLIGKGLFFDPTVKPTQAAEEAKFQRFLDNPAASQDVETIKHNLAAVDAGLDDLIGETREGRILGQLFFGEQLASLESQEATLKQLLAVAESNEQPATPLGQFDPRNAGGVPVQVKNFKDLTLEERLKQDKDFHESVGVQEFLRLLRKTSEFGKKGVGTDIEHGPMTGRDPFGQAFVALVRRLEKPALQSAEVQGEIKRHIIAAEGLQRKALQDGDKHAARKLQQTIDALHQILHTEDRHDATRHRDADRNREATHRVAERTQQMTNRLEAKFNAQSNQLTTANNKLGVIASKDPKVTVNTTVNTNVSINDVIRHSVSQHVATGGGQFDNDAGT